MELREKEYLDKIQYYLESVGCQVWREVIPDECIDWEQPYRVDMIIYRWDIDYIGVEGKWVRTTRRGSIFSKALLQVIKYRKLKYFNGRKIDTWSITYPDNHFNSDTALDMRIFLINFFATFNIKILVYKEYRNKEYNYVTLSPSHQNSQMIQVLR